MSTDPTLSIIIPHLNNPDGLDRCLSALAQQEEPLPVFDVIVVDNGSTVIPQDVCEKYPFVRLIQEETPGPGPARTTGANTSKAVILAFIDSDCIARSGWISSIMAYFGKHPETGVIGGDVRIARVDPNRPTAVECYEGVYGYRMALYVTRDNYTATCNMATRRTVFTEVGGFAGIDVAEDVDWGQRATAIGTRIDYVPDMRIATPARRDFQEMTRKWDRHISHDHAALDGRRQKIKWVFRAGALMISPLVEVGTIIRSDRLNGLSERIKAFGFLTRIRLYRAMHMLRLFFRGQTRGAQAAWREN